MATGPARKGARGIKNISEILFVWVLLVVARLMKRLTDCLVSTRQANTAGTQTWTEASRHETRHRWVTEDGTGIQEATVT